MNCRHRVSLFCSLFFKASTLCRSLPALILIYIAGAQAEKNAMKIWNITVIEAIHSIYRGKNNIGGIGQFQRKRKFDLSRNLIYWGFTWAFHLFNISNLKQIVINIFCIHCLISRNKTHILRVIFTLVRIFLLRGLQSDKRSNFTEVTEIKGCQGHHMENLFTSRITEWPVRNPAKIISLFLLSMMRTTTWF